MLSGTAAGTAAAVLCGSAVGKSAGPATYQIIDTNVSLFQWPFRRLPLDEPKSLVAQLDTLGIKQAWAGSFEALLHRDIAGVNERLVAACKVHGRGRLVPIGAVNPMLPDWQEDLRRCGEMYRTPGIRLHPNYHGYELNDPVFERLVSKATKMGLFVQLATTMEDARTQHPLVQVKDVDLKPLPEIASRIPGARIQLLNLRPRTTELISLAKTAGIHFDVSRADDTDGITRLIRAMPPGRVMFGSHAPFLIPQAALIRTAEGELDDNETRNLLAHHAERFAGKA